METTKRKHDNENEHEAETASLWYFNPSSLKNESIDILKNEFLIGRAKDVDFQVTTQSVSRIHCLIRNVGTQIVPKWELVDKNSTLGTFLNGRKVPASQPAPLKDGDIIYLTNPDVYPIRFVTNSCKPAKVSKPDIPFLDDSDVIMIKDSCGNSVIDLSSTPEQNENNSRSKTGLGLFEDTTVKSCENIINNSCTRSDKAKLLSSNVADKENDSSAEYKLKISLLNQKNQDNEKELDRMRLELKNKDLELKKMHDEVDRISKDKEILKFIEETNNELIKGLHDDLYARKRELEAYQQSNSEEAVLLKTSKTFVELIESELQCSICNEVIVTASITIPCYHVFCNACIGMWFKQKKECAVCRTPTHMRVPCKILDSFIEKLMEMVPDHEYRMKRQQVCEERKNQEQNNAFIPPGPPLQADQLRRAVQTHIVDARQLGLLMDIMGANDRRPQETVTIDLTVADIAAANAAAAAARAAGHADDAAVLGGAIRIRRRRQAPPRRR